MSYKEFEAICILRFNEEFDSYLCQGHTALIPSFSVKVEFKEGEYIERSYLSRFKYFLEDVGGFHVSSISIFEELKDGEVKNFIEIKVG